MKKKDYIQRAYNEGFCDGINSAIRIVRQAEEMMNKAVFDATYKTLSNMKERVV